MEDKVKAAYRQSKNFYDDVLAQRKLWWWLYTRMVMKLVDETQRDILVHLRVDE